MIRRILDSIAIILFVAALPLVAVAQSGVSAISASPGAKPGPGTRTTCTVAGGVWRTSDPAATLECGTGLKYVSTILTLTDGAVTLNFDADNGAESVIYGSGRIRISANGGPGFGPVLDLSSSNNITLGTGSGGTGTPPRYLTLNNAASSTSAVNKDFQFANNPGNTSAGFGTGHTSYGQSSSTVDREMGGMYWLWTVATDASRTSKAQAYNVNNAGTSTATWEAQNGHDQTVGTAPAVSSCGTTPSAVTGSDGNGRLTTGSGGTVQSCTLTFAIAYTTAPSCVANNETAIVLLRATATTTTLVIDSAVAGTMESDVINYICRGN